MRQAPQDSHTLASPRPAPPRPAPPRPAPPRRRLPLFFRDDALRPVPQDWYNLRLHLYSGDKDVPAVQSNVRLRGHAMGEGGRSDGQMVLSRAGPAPPRPAPPRPDHDPPRPTPPRRWL